MNSPVVMLVVVGVPDEDLGDVEDAPVVEDEAAEDAVRQQPVVSRSKRVLEWHGMVDLEEVGKEKFLPCHSHRR